ncbi:MAG: PD40 domain-containing protein [Bacteroidales bacterium]|nr:PD40 domain-containing protein [Bacteroidales bacterium]
MKKLALSFFLLLIIAGSSYLHAQKDQTREDFFDAEYFLSEEDYNEALYSFQKVYKAGYQDNANINYRIGVCYSNIPGRKDLAIPYLEKAVTNISEAYKEGNFAETSAPADAYLYLGNVYRIAYMLDKSIDAYNSYIKLASKNNALDVEFARQQIESCNRAKEALKNPVPLFKENLGKPYNTPDNNFQTVFSGDGNTMAYMSAQKFYDAVYSVKKINGKWTNPVNVTPQVESDGNQYVSSLNYDGSKLFLVRIDNFDGDIMVSDYSMGRWNPSKPIGKPVNSKFFESHASVSPDGKTLYFTSNRTGGQGGMDIYTSTLANDGKWTEPVNMGPVINTPLNEESPFIENDGKTLYFSSQGHSTIGGYDIFTTELQADGTWSVPKPLPYPINTTDDDLFFYPDNQKTGGYITLYDTGGLGEGDIYYIKELPAEEAQVITEPVEEIIPVETTTAEVKTDEPKTDSVQTKAPGIKYVIKPVFFDFDSYQLTDICKGKLDKLVVALNAYPDLKIEVQGYTDAKGSIAYNQILSEKRAKAVTDYLVNHGIDSGRLRIQGFSETHNVAVNTLPDGTDSKEGRMYNRRVEFRIDDLNGALLLIEEVPVPEELKVK